MLSDNEDLSDMKRMLEAELIKNNSTTEGVVSALGGRMVFGYERTTI